MEAIRRRKGEEVSRMIDTRENSDREREGSKVEFSSWNEKERVGRKEERKRGGRASADPGDDGGCDDVHPVPPRVVYRPSLVKCRSAVIYLSRIDASPEVNGRVVTISRRTGQVRAVEDSGVCESRRAREYANIRAVWGLRHGPTRCSLSLGHESSPPPDHIPSHEPLNYFSIEPRGGNDRSRYRVPYLLDIFISDGASLYTGEMIYGLVDSWLDHRPTKVITVIEVVGVHLFF